MHICCSETFASVKSGTLLWLSEDVRKGPPSEQALQQFRGEGRGRVQASPVGSLLSKQNGCNQNRHSQEPQNGSLFTGSQEVKGLEQSSAVYQFH